MSEPEILFMDEPTRSLDPISAVAIRSSSQEHIVGELGSTVRAGDPFDAGGRGAVPPRLAFIQDGRIVADGTVPELRAAIGYGIRCELGLRGASAGASVADAPRRARGLGRHGRPAPRRRDGRGLETLIGWPLTLET